MEPTDVDLIVDVPDTPDRVGPHCINVEDSTGEKIDSSVAVCSRNPIVMHEEPFNRLRSRGRLITESSDTRRLSLNRGKDLSNEIGKQPSGRSLLFRKPAVDKNNGHENLLSLGAQQPGKGKAVYKEVHSKGKASNGIIDLDKQKGYDQLLEMAFPRGTSKRVPAEKRKEGEVAKVGKSSLLDSRSSFISDGNACKGKGKEKMVDDTRKGVGSAGDRKAIDGFVKSEQRVEKHNISIQPSIPPRVAGQKRLVRNGCISPHNIATRSRQLADQNHNSLKDSCVGQGLTQNEVSNDPSLINIRDIVADDNLSDRAKGKRAMIDPHTSIEHNANCSNMSRRPNLGYEKANGTNDANKDSLGCSRGISGWRSTRDHPKRVSQASGSSSQSIGGNNAAGLFVGQQHGKRDMSEKNNMDPVDHNATQRSAILVPGPSQTSAPCQVARVVTKRQRRNGLTLKNKGEHSGMVPDDSEVAFLGSSMPSSSSSSSRIQNCQPRDTLDPIIEIEDSLPEMTLNDSGSSGFTHNDESVARESQLEADEMFARELQEQLYQELPPVFGGAEMDESVAWALQQEDVPYANSRQNHQGQHPRSSLVAHSRRQLTSQSSVNRRVRQTRITSPAQRTHIRSRFSRRAPVASSRARNFRLPSNMNLDVTFEILEALEASVGELGESATNINQIRQLQLDFNDNDYEMLLALDENNHLHSGASRNQINSLPESKVQTDSSGEVCAICLETPNAGETIRHLPCFHKFHKDCIDPWLNRSTSCPVCKSSIT